MIPEPFDPAAERNRLVAERDARLRVLRSKEFVTVKECAELLGISKRTMWRRLPSLGDGVIRDGRIVRLHRATVMRDWLNGVDEPLDLASIGLAEDTGQTVAPVPGWVYFIEYHALIKIGATRDLSKRFRTLAASTDAPIRLLATIPCSTISEAYAHEHRAHADFAADRRHGEWFAISVDVAVTYALNHGGHRTE